MGNYQLSSNNFINSISSISSNNNGKTNSSSINDPSATSNSFIHNSARSSSSSSSLSSSPPKILDMQTNTLPSSKGRSNNILYQTESNYSLKTKQKPFTTSPANNSPFNSFNSISATSATNSLSTTNQILTNGGGSGTNSYLIGNKNALNLHSKTPNNYDSYDVTSSIIKSTNSNASGGGSGNGDGGSIHGNVSAVKNEFEQIIARNAGGATTASYGAGNYNTIGSYRVQYSSTNPFLPSFNPLESDEKKASD